MTARGYLAPLRRSPTIISIDPDQVHVEYEHRITRYPIDTSGAISQLGRHEQYAVTSFAKVLDAFGPARDDIGQRE